MENVYSWVRQSFSIKNKSLSQNDIVKVKEDEEKLYGVNDQLIDLINSFTPDTFKNFPLQVLKWVQFSDEDGANCGDEAIQKSSGNIRNDLSDWQQHHAILALSKVKELSQLRFRLCPRYLKEREFWRIYFTLAKNILAEYELQAVRLHKLNQMKLETENVSDTGSYEVEMSETKHTTPQVIGPQNET